MSRLHYALEERLTELIVLLTRPEGVYARAASAQRQEQLLGWRPKVSFRAGIEKTIEWFAKSHDIDALKTNFEARLFERKV